MCKPIHGLALLTVYVALALSLLFSAASGWQRNSSHPLFEQCMKFNPGQQGRYALESFLDESFIQNTGLHAIQRLEDLRFRSDNVGTRPTGLLAAYDEFARQYNCLSRQTMLERKFGEHEWIQAVTNCYCLPIRNSLIGAVRAIFPCDVAAAPHGELSSVYLALGRRVNVFRRLSVALLSNSTLLDAYDLLVDKCFIEFFERVDNSVDTTGSSVTKASSLRHSDWTMVIIGVATVALYALFFRRRQRPPTVPQMPPSASNLGDATAANGTTAGADGVAQPD